MFVPQKSIAIWMLTKNPDFEMLEGGYSSVLIWKGERDSKRLDKFGEMVAAKYPTRKIEAIE